MHWQLQQAAIATCAAIIKLSCSHDLMRHDKHNLKRMFKLGCFVNLDILFPS